MLALHLERCSCLLVLPDENLTEKLEGCELDLLRGIKLQRLLRNWDELLELILDVADWDKGAEMHH